VSLRTFVEAVLNIPSITTWTRLEPLPRDGSMARSLQAQVRDPLWFLTRQWQIGEFIGDDAGSPVQATFGLEQRTMTTFRPGLDDAATVPLDPALPVETHVEREAVTLNLRGSVQHGLYFERLVRASGVAGPDTVIAAFRTAFPVPATGTADPYPDPDATRFRSVAAGRVTDGEALYVSLAAIAAGQPPKIALPPQATEAHVAAALASFVSYRASLFSEPDHDASWQSAEVDYAFALGSPATDQSLLLNAPDFPGGHLDWYSFDLAAAQPNPVSQANPAQVTPVDLNFLPNHVVFRGMPDPRWWNFEDAVTDFGQLDADHVDLAKLLVMEFALVYGNDWFSVPVQTPIGTLERVTTLVVTDTFGVRTVIRPAEQTQVNAGETPWSMFKLSGAGGARSDFIAMAPTLGLAQDADAIEQVNFLRDDQAAMAWAVEHRLQGDLDGPVDAYEAYLARLKQQPLPPPPQAQQGGPAIYYTLETPVPDNWIPMVPVTSPQGELYMRRGTMEIPTGGGAFQLLKARAVLLEPEHAFLVADRVISRAGLLAARYFRRARTPDGSTFVWLARTSEPGTGPGWSGLRFDLVQPMKPPAQP
jgi:hypothetical protein